MRRRRAHTRLLGDRNRPTVALDKLVTVGGDGAVVDGEPYGSGERSRIEIDTSRRG